MIETTTTQVGWVSTISEWQILVKIVWTCSLRWAKRLYLHFDVIEVNVCLITCVIKDFDDPTTYTFLSLVPSHQVQHQVMFLIYELPSNQTNTVTCSLHAHRLLRQYREFSYLQCVCPWLVSRIHWAIDWWVGSRCYTNDRWLTSWIVVRCFPPRHSRRIILTM